MDYVYTNLTAPRNVTSGIAESVFMAPVDWFAPGGIKMPKPPFQNVGDQVIITEKHVFSNEAFGFFECWLSPEKNNYNANVIGDEGFKLLDHALKIFVPGSYAEVHEQVKELIGVPIIALHRDSDCPSNLWYQLGTDWLEAFVLFDFSTGTTVNGVKGYAGIVQHTNDTVLLYAGGIIKQGELVTEGDFSDDFSADFKI